MKVNDGLYPNANPNLVRSDIKSYALNIVYNEDGGTLCNENGFEKHIDFAKYGTCIGIISIPTGAVFFFTKQDGELKRDFIIYHSEEDIKDIQFKDSNITLPKVIRNLVYETNDKEGNSTLNFSINRPITGTYSYNKDNHLIITMSEGNMDEANETRIINLNTIAQYPYTEYEHAVDTNEVRIVLKSSRDLNAILNIIPDVIYPTIWARALNGGGLLCGAYQFAVAYKLDSGEYTDYSLLSMIYYASPIYGEDIKPGNPTTRKFVIDFVNLDKAYKKFKLGIIYKNEVTEKAYEMLDIDIDKKYVELYGINTLKEVTLEDIVIGTVSYIKDQAHTNFNSQLIRANVSTNKIEEIDEFLKSDAKENSLITASFTDKGNIKVVSKNISFYDLQTDSFTKNVIGHADDFINNDYSNDMILKDNEVYMYYIGFIDYKGKLINCYPIYNLDTKSYLFDTSAYNTYPDDEFGTEGYYRGRQYFFDCSKLYDILFNKSSIKDIVNKQIKSFIIYQAQPNNTNSNWLCQSLILRDIAYSTIGGDQYKYPFASLDRFRMYPLEYLIQNKKAPKMFIQIFRESHEPMHYIRCINRGPYARQNDDNKESGSTKEGGDLAQSLLIGTYTKRANKDNFDLRTDTIEPIYIEHNNSAVSNIGGDTHYRFNTTKSNFGNEFFAPKLYLDDEGNIDKTFIPNYSFLQRFYNTDKFEDRMLSIMNKMVTVPGQWLGIEHQEPDDIYYDFLYENAIIHEGEGYPDNNLNVYKYWKSIVDTNRAIVDCFKFNPIKAVDQLKGVDPYNQNLVAVTPILSIDEMKKEVAARGDTFIALVTQRCTCPAFGFNYEGVDNNIEHCHRFVISYIVLSRMNLQCRHSGNTLSSQIYKIPKFSSLDYTILIIGSTPIDETRYYKALYKSPYHEQVMELAYRTQGITEFFHTDDGSCYDICMNYDGFKDAVVNKNLEGYTNNFPTRIIRSDINPSESTTLGWRKYKADAYKDVNIQKGVIENLLSDDKAVYIQQRFTLLVAALKDTLSNNDANATYVGTSDLFSREPKEIIFSNTGKIGSNNRFSAIVSQYGYLVSDIEKGELYLVKNDTGVKELSDIGFKEWFKEHIRETDTNPFTSNGAFFTYDDINKRFIFTVKHLLPNGSVDLKSSYSISYSLKTNMWMSFHSYIPDYSYINRKGIYYLKDNKVYQAEAKNKAIYFDNIIHPSVIQFIYATEPNVSKLIKFIEWRSHLISGLLKDDTNLRYIYDKTIDWLMVHTDVQSTGLLPMYISPKWYDDMNLKYKANRYIWNRIEDFIDNDKAHICLNPNELNFLDREQIDKLIKLSIDSTKPWYNVGKIMNAWAYITMIYENRFYDETKNDYIVDDKLEAIYDYSKSKEVNVDAVQLDFRLTNIDIYAVKDNRV